VPVNVLLRVDCAGDMALSHTTCIRACVAVLLRAVPPQALRLSMALPTCPCVHPSSTRRCFATKTSRQACWSPARLVVSRRHRCWFVWQRAGLLRASFVLLCVGMGVWSMDGGSSNRRCLTCGVVWSGVVWCGLVWWDGVATLLSLQVKRVGTYGVVVALSDLVQGLITPMHLADTRVRKMSRVFKVGKKLKCRVLTSEPEKHRAHLTLMPTLVTSELPPLVTYPDPSQSGASAGPFIGSVVHGFVTAVKPAGVIVTFYNNVHGLVPSKALAKAGVEDVAAAFPMGKPTKCRIMKSDPQRRRLLLSLATAGGSHVADVASSGDVTKFQPGVVVSGKVLQRLRSPDGEQPDVFTVQVTLADGATTTTAQLPVPHLGDHLRLTNVLAVGLRQGTELPKLIVVEVSSFEQRRGRPSVIVSAKPLLVNAPRAQLALSMDDVVEGAMLRGVVSHTTDFGVFVRFMGGVSGTWACGCARVHGTKCLGCLRCCLLGRGASWWWIDHGGSRGVRVWLSCVMPPPPTRSGYKGEHLDRVRAQPVGVFPTRPLCSRPSGASVVLLLFSRGACVRRRMCIAARQSVRASRENVHPLPCLWLLRCHVAAWPDERGSRPRQVPADVEGQRCERCPGLRRVCSGRRPVCRAPGLTVAG